MNRYLEALLAVEPGPPPRRLGNRWEAAWRRRRRCRTRLREDLADHDRQARCDAGWVITGNAADETREALAPLIILESVCLAPLSRAALNSGRLVFR